METQEIYIYSRYRNQANVQWNDNAYYYANMYLLANLRSLKLCQKCFQLYGPIRLQDGQLVKQECYCRMRRDEERWHEIIDGTKYYHDFNREYEICHCCGLEIIPSGSRWSLFYCQDCKGKIRKLNEMVGKCIIPYGRHSIMNSVSLSGEKVKDKMAIDEFVMSLNKMNQKVDIVEKHRKTIAKKQIAFLQLRKDAPAIDLVLKSYSNELEELKKESFLELVSLTFGRTIDETKKFYLNVFENKEK